MSTSQSPGRPTTWVYTLRKTSKGAALNVPRAVADQLPDGMTFRLEVTDKGLLYKPVQVVNEEAEVDIPWAGKFNGEESR